MTHRQPIGSRGDFCGSPLPLARTPIGHLGVIYDSQPAGIQKKTPQTGGSSYFLFEKSLLQHFLYI
jgi:hypothetical protein